MRLFLFITLITAILMGSSAPEAAAKLGAENNYTKALCKAQKEQKLLLMVIVKEHCRWCDKLVNRTLSDPQVTSMLPKDYVLLIVDRFDEYPEAFESNFFPTIFFIDPKSQKSLYENLGYTKVPTFLEDMNATAKLYKK